MRRERDLASVVSGVESGTGNRKSVSELLFNTTYAGLSLIYGLNEERAAA